MILEYFFMSLETLTHNRFRTFLTLLAIVIGSFSMVLMTSLARSGLGTIMSGIESMGGSRLLFLSQKQPERARKKAFYSKGLNRYDLNILRERLPYLKSISAKRQALGQEISVRGTNKPFITDILAADKAFLGTFGMELQKGRIFSQGDMKNLHRTIVLGNELAKKLFGNTNPLKKEVTLFGVPYRVIGVMKKNHKMGVQIGFNWNNFAVIPEPTFREKEELPSALEFFIITTDKSKNEIVKRIMNVLLEKRHNHVDDYIILDFNKLMKQFKTIFSMISIIISVIAGIALVIGGVGIMNIMIVSVNERMNEIGIRRAVGATSKSITSQFLIEATFLSMTGGLLGIILAIIVKFLSDKVIIYIEPSWAGTLNLNVIVSAFTVSLLVGVIFGWFPARKAANMNIDSCLRVERG